jgi:formylglycine-generating enzyme required for sulfatase activity
MRATTTRRLYVPALAIVPAACAPACSSLPPYAEALVIVDTDLPAPQIASHLRVDLYAQDGTWYSSRDKYLPSADMWPASFGIYSTNETLDTWVLLRLRAYPDGLVRDYLGEQYRNEDGPLPGAAGPGATGPRLVVDGTDVTPPTEPQPLVTVDRLVLFRLQPGVQGSLHVTLHGECAGTMALLSRTPPYQTPTVGQASTCIERQNVLTLVTETTLSSDLTIPPAAGLGTFGAGQPCAPDDSSAVAACVPGGVFVLGDSRVIDMGGPYDAVPQRLVAMTRFWLGRNEVTVGELRSAMSAGFYRGRSLPIGVHDGPLGESLPSDAFPLDRWCTFSTAPSGREDYPLSCIDWTFARDYCVFVGGDLPTEAQWEYAASAAGRASKTDFPWGDGAWPTCREVSFDRYALDVHTPKCSSLPAGPEPVSSTPFDTTPEGLVDLGGSQAELTLDELAAYSAPCWNKASLHDQSCTDAPTTLHTMRGGGWAYPEAALLVAWRNDSGLDNVRSAYGFRCAFPSRPKP